MTKPATPLRSHRERAGLTQLQLAARAGTCVQTISLAERGLPLSPAMAAKLAVVLGIAPELLRPEPRP